MLFDEPPKTIWLQYHGDAEPDDSPVPDDCITWCWDQIYEHDVKYVRADIAEQRVQAAREEYSERHDRWARNESAPTKAEWLLAGRLIEAERLASEADRLAREECADICRRLQSRDYCVDVRQAEREIRATIKHGSLQKDQKTLAGGNLPTGGASE